MTVPKWLIPVLAGIAAIAVGVAAALFAVRFAAPDDMTVTPQTLDAPVIAPVSGGQSLEDLVGEEGDDIPVSGAYGIETVVDPDSVPEGGLPEDLADLLDELEDAEDPADVLPAVETTTPAPSGDPCADTDDPAALGCPPGTPGTIVTFGGELPALLVRSSGGNSDDCPAPEPGSVRFIAFANAPVTFDVGYTQGYSQHLALETTPEQTADWEERREAAPEDELVWIEYCIEIPDLRVDRSVNVYLRVTDRIGRTGQANVVMLMVSDGLDVPPTRIHSIGDSTIFASAPHTEDEVVRMYVFDREDENSRDCRYDFPVAGNVSFPTLRDPATEVVSDAFLAEHAYEPDFTRRTSATFAVPPATQLFVCLGWFPVTDGRPSFERDTPLRVSEFPMTSPDVSAPRVVVSEVETFGDLAAGSATMRATTENGQFCGSWDIADGAGMVLCDYAELLGRHDAGGSMLVTTEVDVPEGHAVNRVLLDVSLLSCEGGCAGRTRVFDVPLSSFIRPTSICSDDCFVNAGESVGIVRLEVTWPATTTGEGWLHGDWREGADVLATPAKPQLDLDASFQVRPSTVSERAFAAMATIDVDRPVLATADVVSLPGEGVTCPWSGGSTHWDGGGASTVFTVRFDGLCAGLGHTVALTLTDPATGEVATYTLGYIGIADFEWWPGAVFTTPAIDRNVAITSATFDLGDRTRLIRPSEFEVWVAGEEYAFPLPREVDQNCWFGGIPNRNAGARVIGVGETIQLEAEVRFRPGDDPGRPNTDDGRPTFCDAGSWSDEERVTFTGTITYDQLVAGPTVTLTDPETGYSVTLVLSDHL